MAASFAEQLSHAKAVGNGRSDCPSCGGKNTFGVSTEGRQLKWQCFRSACKARGVAVRQFRVGDSLNEPKATQRSSMGHLEALPRPDSFPGAMSYLERVGSLEAYKAGRADIRMDVPHQRVVFLIREGGTVVDGVGRSLVGVQPKWRRYGNSELPFVCGSGDVCVLVEDAPSACAVSHRAVGFALLGTSILASYLPLIKRFKVAIIALDKDASKKAIDKTRLLTYFTTVRMLPMDEDFKSLPAEHVNLLLDGCLNEDPSHHIR